MTFIQKAKNVSRIIHFVSCAFLIIGVCCSKFLMSMGLLLGGLSFITSGEVKASIIRLFKNPFFILITSFYILHLVGLIWSENLTYGLNDVRQKSSLLIIPIILLHRNDWNQKKIDDLLKLFLATLLLSSLINFISFFFFRSELELLDIRNMSLFESHIRFGILIGLGAGVTLYFIKNKLINTYFLFTLLIWFGFYSYYSQVLSGIISFLICFYLFALFQIANYRKILYSLLSLPLLIALGILYYLQLPLSYPSNEQINDTNLSKAWNTISSVSYDSLDAKSQPIKHTLTRYLYSKSIPLDSSGVASLTNEDVNNIEKGYADIRETTSGLPARLFQIRFELQHPGNPNLHPITERLELWENAWYTIQKHPYLGVGNGDVEDALQLSYEERKSKLTKERRLRAHQSYLTFWISFGIVGLLSFFYLQGYFLIKSIKQMNLLALSFGVIAFITFCFEDTLETQAGITFFSFFYGLFSIQLSNKLFN